MRTADILRRAGRSLRQAKGRTFLTSLAIAVGAFTLTLSMAAGEGARSYADNLLKNNIDPRAVFVTKDDSLTSGSGGSVGLQEYDPNAAEGYRPGSTVKLLTRDDVQKLQQRDDLEQVIPIYNVRSTYVQFEGVDKKYSATTTYYDATVLKESVAGTIPPLGEQIKDDQVLVPEEFAATLGIAPRDLVGRSVTMMFTKSPRNVTSAEIQAAFQSGGQQAVENLVKTETKTYEFTVSGVIKKPALAIASVPQLYISTNTAKTVTEFTEGDSETAGQVVGVTALAKQDPEATKEAIIDEYGFNVQTAKDAQSLLFTIVNILQGIVAGFAMLALIASVFGIINTQYISVLERTSQIGLMKALGMPKGAVAKLFRYEAAWIGFLGGVIGAVVAMAAGAALNPFITEALDLGEHQLLQFVWWHIALMVAGLVVVAIVAGWLPSRKAAKLDPIEALRTE